MPRPHPLLASGSPAADLTAPMQLPPPDFIAELFRQMAFIGAFLGGFAASFLATLLTEAPDSRVATWTIGAAALSSASFVAATLGATVVALDATRLGLRDFAAMSEATSRTQFWSGGLFLLGIYGLLLAVGLSGWTRSRAAGWATTAAAVVGAVGTTVALAASMN